MESIFPSLFVERMPASWAIPENHYDAARQISIENETGLPAFERGVPSAIRASSCTYTSTSDSQMGINRGQDDSTTHTDSD